MPQLSPQVRIFALVAALAAVGAALAMFTLGRGSTEPAAVAPPAGRAAGCTDEAGRTEDPGVEDPGVQGSSAEGSSGQAGRAARKGRREAEAAPGRRSAAEESAARAERPPARRRRRPALARDRRRLSLRSRAPASTSSQSTRRAPAQQLGGAGFVALNVLEEKTAKPLLDELGTLEDPSLLVVKRPGEIALRMSGFVDRDTVAQAAANASS